MTVNCRPPFGKKMDDFLVGGGGGEVNKAEGGEDVPQLNLSFKLPQSV